MIKIVLDSIIPGDKELKMPPASQLDFNSYKISHGIEKIEIDFLLELTKISNDKFSNLFIELDENQKIEALNLFKLKDIRLFTTFLKNIFRFYYSDIRVLSLINVGSSPPFPKGNIIEEDDWTMLIPVYERGPIYREFDNE
ncbi:hypothetical protein N9K53_01125 [Candidatus Thioglobus sp.]|jgi:hypothetical protein|nr:hypothetical protein [Candidatus Thioglobus sp.]MDA9060386.1 hypothetical protein [Candidatus Thioglobus sp.]